MKPFVRSVFLVAVISASACSPKNEADNDSGAVTVTGGEDSGTSGTGDASHPTTGADGDVSADAASSTTEDAAVALDATQLVGSWTAMDGDSRTIKLVIQAGTRDADGITRGAVEVTYEFISSAGPGCMNRVHSTHTTYLAQPGGSFVLYPDSATQEVFGCTSDGNSSPGDLNSAGLRSFAPVATGTVSAVMASSFVMMRDGQSTVTFRRDTSS